MPSSTFITVTARDGDSNLIPNATASLTSSGTGNTFNPTFGYTNVNGIWSSSFSSTVAEVKIISASVNGILLHHTASVTVQPASVSAESSSIVTQYSTIDAG